MQIRLRKPTHRYPAALIVGMGALICVLWQGGPCWQPWVAGRTALEERLGSDAQQGVWEAGVAATLTAACWPALNNSVQVKPTSPRRVGIDPHTGDYVVFERTHGNEYHGHVRTWDELRPEMRSALQKAGLADHRGRALP